MSDQDQQQQQPAHEPMTVERLAEIMSLTADVVAGRIHVRFDEETAWLAILDLRREVERQRDLLAFAEAALPILSAVARYNWQDTLVCAYCNAELYQDSDHQSDCPVTQARALLAGTGEHESDESEGQS